MTESKNLIEIAFYVSLFTIIALALTFSILFALYAIYKKKHIKYGHEDDKLYETLRKKYHKEFKENDKILEKNAKIRRLKRDKWEEISSVGKDDVVTYLYHDGDLEEKERKKIVDLIKQDEKKSKIREGFGRAFSVLLYAIVIFLIGFVVYFNVNGENFYFGKTTYMVIQTGSMETVNTNNAYVSKNNLKNQISQFSLIGVDKVEEKDIQLYDVLAFKNSENITIVHRLINVNVKDGVTYYTFRGDANSSSDISEMAITADKIIGKYNGFNNFGLGVTITYFKSTAGIVALASVAVFMITFDSSEEVIDKEYKKRFLVVASYYDEDVN